MPYTASAKVTIISYEERQILIIFALEFNYMIQIPFRIGHGYDVHALGEGLELWLGGVRIPHTKGCIAHSARGPGSRRHRSAFSGYFGGILRHRQQDPAAEGGYFSPLAWLCSIQCRHHHRRTASQARPLHRPDAADLGRHPRSGHLSGLCQGHHDRAPRLHRPRGGHRRLGLSPAAGRVVR